MFNRRQWLGGAADLGAVALAWMAARDARAGSESSVLLPHHQPRAKRIIQIFNPGGVSHVDTFDYKPELIKRAGQDAAGFKVDTFFGRPGRLMPSPFAFAQHGQTGAWVSDLFPYLARQVDHLTFLHGMVSKSPNHTPAAFQLNTGFIQEGFPCLGSWLSFALGRSSDNLPTFAVLPDPRGLPAGGSVNWSNGFLPAEHQGVAFRSRGILVDDLERPADVSAVSRGRALEFVRSLDERLAQTDQSDTSIRARMEAYVLAGKMQASIPEAANLDAEGAATRRMYGVDDPLVGPTARNFLLARRLVERGVRFVQVIHGGAFGSPRINWDGHEDISVNHRVQARLVDQPVAALLTDLRVRGMKDDTPVLWTTEFGRTPITEGVGAKGRDHHPLGFTMWMAGAGLKPGLHHGITDDFGFAPVEGKTTVYDFHATVLHLLGLDHHKVTFYHNGARRRLTDVHGEIISDILV